MKTGTTKDMRDNWCIGFTSRYTVGVWVGNFSGAPMRDVSGVTGAAPIFRDLVHFLHRDDAVARAGASVERGRHGDGLRPAVRAAATGSVRARHRGQRSCAPPAHATTRRNRRRAFAIPAADTVIALDPDVPMSHQRVAFVAAPAIDGLRWRVDGHAAGHGRCAGVLVTGAGAPSHHAGRRRR